MNATKGRVAQLNQGASMKIAGSIRLIVKPEHFAELAAGKPASIDLGTPGTGEWSELVLQIEPGPENRIKELTPWFNLDEVPLRIQNSAAIDGPDDVHDYFKVHLEQDESRNLGFLVNPKQARAIADVLMNYVRICEGINALMAEPAIA
ncbi:MAG: hypothetical protein ABFD52_04940 [Acidobacteriota bacterium]